MNCWRIRLAVTRRWMERVQGSWVCYWVVNVGGMAEWLWVDISRIEPWAAQRFEEWKSLVFFFAMQPWQNLKDPQNNLRPAPRKYDIYLVARYRLPYYLLLWKTFGRIDGLKRSLVIEVAWEIMIGAVGVIVQIPIEGSWAARGIIQRSLIGCFGNGRDEPLWVRSWWCRHVVTLCFEKASEGGE